MDLKLSWPAWVNFLPYRVPYLKLDAFIFDGYHLGPEFHSNGDVVLVAVAIIGELEQQARFSDT